MKKFKFRYSMTKGLTVTVRANNWEEAADKAIVELDNRYAKLGKEPPVAWTLWRTR